MTIQPTTSEFKPKTQDELEAFLLFAIAVAGKSARTTEKAFEKLWKRFELPVPGSPMQYILFGKEHNGGGYLSADTLRQCGFGCYNHRLKSFVSAALAVANGLNLRTCSAEDLEKIHGVGLKTSRFFLMNTRENYECAVIDTHVLKFFRASGYQCVPKATPSSKCTYRYWERRFLEIAKREKLTPRELDNKIWLAYSGHGDKK